MKLMRRVRGWAGRIGLWRKLAIALVVAALAAGVATYLAVTGEPPFAGKPGAIVSLFNLDLALLFALGVLIANRLLQVWAERRRGLAGSRLQIRLVVLFGLIAVIPTVFVAFFSYLFFSYGVQAWFSDRVRTAISNSLAVAEAYLHEHQQAIRADALAMANDLNRDAVQLALDPARLDPGGVARSDRGDGVRPRRPCPGPLEPVLYPQFRAGSRWGDARRRRGRGRDHDQRQRQSGARAGPPRSIRPRLFVCRPLYRAQGPQLHGGNATRRRTVPAGREPAFRVSGDVCADLFDGGDAVSGWGGCDRDQFRHPARHPDQSPGHGGRAGARRRPGGPRARGRAR